MKEKILALKERAMEKRNLSSKKGMEILQLVGVILLSLAAVIIIGLSVMGVIGNSEEGAAGQMEDQTNQIFDITDTSEEGVE